VNRKEHVIMIFVGALLVIFMSAVTGAVDMGAKYEPNKKSISKHQAPDWYHAAKFGIFIHWSLSSVPGYAPVGKGSIWEIVAEHGFEGHFKNNPYAEWYLNTMKIEGSPTRKFHRQNYGPDFSYDDFVPEFNRAIENWSPDEWADLFKEVGARYVVLVTKHHDGFLLWPSSRPNPFKKDYYSGRDLVGELTGAVKSRGMRMGFYYSGGLDWTFNEKPITDAASMITNGPVSREYADYVEYHFRELIDKYEPSILWNDICYPPKGDLYGLLAYYCNQITDGVINDRWMQIPGGGRKLLNLWPIKNIINRIGSSLVAKQGLKMPKLPAYADYTTPEYTTIDRVSEYKWECVRGIGHSFGYNRMETEEHYMKAPEAVRMLVDIVSKNGNLLLDIGPRADGSIPEEQIQCLKGIGEWLEVNGEAIYGTRPWVMAEGKTACGVDIRFTKKDGKLYAILMDTPPRPQIEIIGLKPEPGTKIGMLGLDSEFAWSQEGENLKITLPDKLPQSPAHAIVISHLPIFHNHSI